MLRAYLKFCGGCNPHYDRGAVAKELNEHFAGRVEFLPHDPAVPCTIGIVIQGCENECVRSEALARAEHLIFLRDRAMLNAVTEQIEALLHGKTK